MSDTENTYEHIRSGGSGFYEQKRGLIAVWGKEAVQFLDGLISNDMKTLEDGQQMLAAFPNAQGRLLAVVRVLRQGEKDLFETEDATREKVFQNLFRFTFAGDFFVEDLSEQYRYVEVFGSELPASAGGFLFDAPQSKGYFIENDRSDEFLLSLKSAGAMKISDGLYETLRIENGIPKYGVDMDDTTIVPELGIDGLISYNKGCYIGQEIIARIYFRGHVAKRLTGMVLSEPVAAGSELITLEGKNAGRITSVTLSPKLDKTIALAFVRYDYLASGTELKVGEITATVAGLPFLT
ncbi:MAG TPA: glycine cleavage T C-terminal barrel domain-containing protein [Pyrinomonadaceae bacterium]|nr:glycine cleavage T C-terminal barrel domain-containing protein [Pyrinomonadaceae bacterium]